MNNQDEIVKKNWSELKGEVKKNWNKLTYDDIEKTKGSVSAISSLVQQKHGINPDQFDKKFADIIKHFDSENEMNSQEKPVGPNIEPRQSDQSQQTRDLNESRYNHQ